MANAERPFQGCYPEFTPEYYHRQVPAYDYYNASQSQQQAASPSCLQGSMTESEQQDLSPSPESMQAPLKDGLDLSGYSPISKMRWQIQERLRQQQMSQLRNRELAEQRSQTPY